METPKELDQLDLEILRRLSHDARKSYLEMARELEVSNATIHERVTKLRKRGVLEGFYARINARKVGRPITAFVGLITAQNKGLPKLVERLRQIGEIEEAHTVTGKYDFLLKLRARSNEELQELLNRVGSIPGVARHETMIALTTILENPAGLL
ncbi:MAG: Lrp/AsnC ligand binding domain-containing protein [Acidobacteriota bacterium]